MGSSCKTSNFLILTRSRIKSYQFNFKIEKLQDGTRNLTIAKLVAKGVAIKIRTTWGTKDVLQCIIAGIITIENRRIKLKQIEICKSN